jgi:hypothetical protein
MAWALWRGPRSRGKAECVGNAQENVDEMRKDKNTGEVAHSHLAGQEIRIICNLNFV